MAEPSPLRTVVSCRPSEVFVCQVLIVTPKEHHNVFSSASITLFASHSILHLSFVHGRAVSLPSWSSYKRSPSDMLVSLTSSSLLLENIAVFNSATLPLLHVCRLRTIQKFKSAQPGRFWFILKRKVRRTPQDCVTVIHSTLTQLFYVYLPDPYAGERK